MVMVDSSVWIDFFQGKSSREAGGYELLHADRDFDSMAPHLGLQTL